jgi:hypothetical protein
MGRACSSHGESKNTYGTWGGTLEGKRALHGRLILKLILKKWGVDWTYLAQNTEVTGASEHSNEMLGTTEGGESFHYISDS